MARSRDREDRETLDSGHHHVYQIQVKHYCFTAYYMIIVTMLLASWQVANLKKSSSQTHHGLGLGALAILDVPGQGCLGGRLCGGHACLLYQHKSVCLQHTAVLPVPPRPVTKPLSCTLLWANTNSAAKRSYGFFDIRLRGLKKSMISWSKFFTTKDFLAVIRSKKFKYPPLTVAKLFPRYSG